MEIKPKEWNRYTTKYKVLWWIFALVLVDGIWNHIRELINHNQWQYYLANDPAIQRFYSTAGLPTGSGALLVPAMIGGVIVATVAVVLFLRRSRWLIPVLGLGTLLTIASIFIRIPEYAFLAGFAHAPLWLVLAGFSAWSLFLLALMSYGYHLLLRPQAPSSLRKAPGKVGKKLQVPTIVLALQWTIMIIYLLAGLQGMIGLLWGGGGITWPMWTMLFVGILEAGLLFLLIIKDMRVNQLNKTLLVLLAILTFALPLPKGNSDPLWPILTVPLLLILLIQMISLQKRNNPVTL